MAQPATMFHDRPPLCAFPYRTANAVASVVMPAYQRTEGTREYRDYRGPAGSEMSNGIGAF
jgi:hypothetical protein